MPAAPAAPSVPGARRQRCAPPAAKRKPGRTVKRPVRRTAAVPRTCRAPGRAGQHCAAPTVPPTARTALPEACRVPGPCRQRSAAPTVRRTTRERTTVPEAGPLPSRARQRGAAPATGRRTTVSGAWPLPGPTRQRCAAPTVPPTAPRRQPVPMSMSAAPEARWAAGSRLRWRVGPGLPRAAWRSPAAPAVQRTAEQRCRWRAARCCGRQLRLRRCPGAACLLLRDDEALRATSVHRLRSRMRGGPAPLRLPSRAPLGQRPSAESGCGRAASPGAPALPGGPPARPARRTAQQATQRARRSTGSPTLPAPARRRAARQSPVVEPHCGEGWLGPVRWCSPTHSAARAPAAGPAEGPWPGPGPAAVAGRRDAAAPRPGPSARTSRRRGCSAARTSAASPTPTDAPGAGWRRLDARSVRTPARAPLRAPPGPMALGPMLLGPMVSGPMVSGSWSRAAPRLCARAWAWAWAPPRRSGSPVQAVRCPGGRRPETSAPRPPTALPQRRARPPPPGGRRLLTPGQAERPAVPAWRQSHAGRRREERRSSPPQPQPQQQPQPGAFRPAAPCPWAAWSVARPARAGGAVPVPVPPPVAGQRRPAFGQRSATASPAYPCQEPGRRGKRRERQRPTGWVPRVRPVVAPPTGWCSPAPRWTRCVARAAARPVRRQGQ